MPDVPQGRFGRSWRLFTLSLQILSKEKKLLFFPAGIMLFHLGFVIFFVVPSGLLVSGLHWADLGSLKAILRHVTELAPQWPKVPPLFYHWEPYAYLGALYLLSILSATFFNVAFYHEILKALAGENVSILAGLRYAGRRFRAILMWSIFAAAVGVILKALEERVGWIGRLALGLSGMAWSAASVFIIPVMIRDDSFNPITLLKGSANTLRKTWGESLTAYLGVRLGGVVVFFVAPLLLLFGIFLLFSWLHLFKLRILLNLLLVAVVLWALALIVFDFLLGVCGDVFRCALYIYATEGVLPTPYTPDLMDAAWKVRYNSAFWPDRRIR